MAYMIVDEEKGTVLEDLSHFDMPTDPDLLYQRGAEDATKNWISGQKVRRTHVIVLIVIILIINIVVLLVVRCRMKR